MHLDLHKEEQNVLILSFYSQLHVRVQISSYKSNIFFILFYHVQGHATSFQ